MTDLGARWVDRIERRRSADDDEPVPARRPRRRRRRRRFKALPKAEHSARARIGARRGNAAQRLAKVLGELGLEGDE